MVNKQWENNVEVNKDFMTEDQFVNAYNDLTDFWSIEGMPETSTICNKKSASLGAKAIDAIFEQKYTNTNNTRNKALEEAALLLEHSAILATRSNHIGELRANVERAKISANAIRKLKV